MKKPAKDARRAAPAVTQAAIGVLGGRVAHEISNPNQVIQLGADFFSRAWSAAENALDRTAKEDADLRVAGIPWSQARVEVPAALANIRAACTRIDAIVRGLVSLARRDCDGMRASLDLDLVVRAALSRTAGLVEASTRHVTIDLASNLPCVRGLSGALEEAVVNLLANACQALRSREDALSVTTSFDAGTREVVLRVMDGGRGMNPAELRQIKDPFFTTRRECGGLGLGVPVADAIIAAHGGSLAFTSRAGHGTTAIVRLPADTSPVEDV